MPGERGLCGFIVGGLVADGDGVGDKEGFGASGGLGLAPPDTVTGGGGLAGMVLLFRRSVWAGGCGLVG